MLLKGKVYLKPVAGNPVNTLPVFFSYPDKAVNLFGLWAINQTSVGFT